MAQREGMDVPDCRKCGACCVATAWSTGVPHEPFAEVAEDEAERIEERKPGAISAIRPAGFFYSDAQFAMSVKQDARGRCVALSGTIGKCVSCSIYEVRPSACSGFVAGGEECKTVRLKVLARA